MLTISDTRYVYMYVLCLQQSPVPASRLAQWQTVCFYVLLCMVITGYWISSNSQQ